MISKNQTKTFLCDKNGFSTLEILIALTILVLTLSAVVLVSFGNQSLLIDSQTSGEALNIAQGLLEKAQADARKDFNLVNSTSTTVSDGFYRARVDVSLLTGTAPSLDFFTKEVKALISWTGDHNRTQSVSLSALVTNFNNAVGGDTCSSTLLPDADAWKNPQIKNTTTDFTQLAGLSGAYPITDVDAYKNRLYVTVGDTPNKQDPTFFIFDISNSLNLTLLGKLDNTASTSSGLNAVTVADFTDAGGNKKSYAFVANARSIAQTDPTFGQLQVIDVTNPAPGSWNPTVMSLKMSGVSGTSGQGVGNSIFYRSGYVYLGLTKTGGGPEFNIIDVHDPLNPFKVGEWSVGNGINAIYVKNGYAYLATPNDRELIVLDVSDPGNSTEVSYFDTAGSGNGKSIYAVGDNLYFGRTVDGVEFYILNNTDPVNIFANNPNPPSKDIGSSVDGLIVRYGLDGAALPSSHSLAFLLTKTQLQIFDISNPSDIKQWMPTHLNLSASSDATFEPVFDCEGNNFFVGSNTGSETSVDNSYLSVIAP